MMSESIMIAQDDELGACTRHSHIHAPKVAQGAYLPIAIATHERHYNNVALLTLKSIYGIDRYQMTERFEEGIFLYQMT